MGGRRASAVVKTGEAERAAVSYDSMYLNLTGPFDLKRKAGKGAPIISVLDLQFFYVIGIYIKYIVKKV